MAVSDKPYKADCPNPTCNGHNFYITPHNQFGYCFNCGYYEKGGEHNDTPQKTSENVEAIRDLYTQATKYYHSAVDTTARNYLHQRGFTDRTIQELQIGYCPTGMSPMYKGKIAKEAGIAHYDGSAFLGDRITFPYLTTDVTVTDIRGRSMNPFEEVKYKSLLGSSYYRGAVYPYNDHLQCNAQRILITEGEIKADIAYQYNYPTIAMPGMVSWRSGFKYDNNKEYIIVFDNQVKNYYDVQRAIIKAHKKIPIAKIATLPLLGRKKQDIDGFILAYGITAFDMIIRGALSFDSWYALQRL